jgi:hypothetical protein
MEILRDSTELDVEKDVMKDYDLEKAYLATDQLLAITMLPKSWFRRFVERFDILKQLFAEVCSDGHALSC